LFTKKFRDSAKRFFCNFFRRAQNLNIQNNGYDDKEEEEGVSRSLLDSTSVENISPHNFTNQSMTYENATPVPLEVDNHVSNH
jgi:hypothetical protein